ncbi:hypothetical protein TSUD_401350 [Trifolium subterraneum]|uniref:Uncharacterized protein n=1 Tax=Trifolium subterraneum TaxID=3900 RepID=A0A2Z6NUV9_TRISU|nr:hypothetical protein TSUD_401350 [Trifolium subterraneum]
MKVLYWNIRGIGNPDSRLMLKNICNTHKHDVLFVAEPMVNFESVPLWFWKSIKIHSSDQCIALEFSEHSNKFYIAAVYARAREKWGRRPPSRVSCDDFLFWSNAHSLTHLPTMGTQLTWNNGRLGSEYVALRLDRTICNMEWINLWHKISCYSLVRNSSDHHPILFSQELFATQHALPFRFFKVWLEHEDCARVVKDIWGKHVIGSPMARLQQKLKRLKKALKDWNRNIFVNMHNNVDIAVSEVNRIQLLIDSGDVSDELMLQDYQAQLILSKALIQHDNFWREKARSQHFIYGDRNTSYFHRLAKIKMFTKQITTIREGDTIHDNQHVIEQHILDYFTTIFSNSNNRIHTNMVSTCIPTLVTQADNTFLCEIPSTSEVKKVVFEMNADGAPGPDGFGGFPAFLGYPGADCMGDFRLISLANFQFKIITKILADRLAIVVPTKTFSGNMALKIDIKKAFDTLDWNFLLSGDPLSPLLFCIAEEVLSRAITIASDQGRIRPMNYCRGVNVPTHILYADEIMLFCKATQSNVRCILDIFQRYGESSGQIINKQKSKLYAGGISNARISSLASLLGFMTGSIPFNYLGCPIFQGKPKRQHFQAIADKIKIKLATWKGMLLVCTVSWKTVCSPFESGGLGIRSVRRINDSLMLKLGWSFLSHNAPWAKMFRSRFLRSEKPVQHYIKSSIWPGLKGHMDNIISNSVWVIGDGTNINYWTDNWLGEPLAGALNLPDNVCKTLNTRVCDLLENKRWLIPPIINALAPWLVEEIRTVIIPLTPLEDKLVWKNSKDGDLSAKDAYLHLTPPPTSLHWATLIWQGFIPPSCSFILWRIIHNKMPTDDNLRLRGCTVVSVCVLCKSAFETSEHLFLSCQFAQRIWSWLAMMINCSIDLTLAKALLLCCGWQRSHTRDVILSSIIHTVHTLWMARNGILFNNASITLHSAITKIRTAVKLSASLSNCVVGSGSVLVLQNFMIDDVQQPQVSSILVCWKAPCDRFLKVNTDGSLISATSACGAIFRDKHGTYFGSFSCKINCQSVLHAELMAIILAIEQALERGWLHLWVESDSQVAIQASKNFSIVPWDLRNRWSNCFSHNMQLLFSHVFREGNCCADKLANHGHNITGFHWWDFMPPFLQEDFYRDRYGVPYFRRT